MLSSVFVEKKLTVSWMFWTTDSVLNVMKKSE